MTMSTYMSDLRARVGVALLQVPTAGVLVFSDANELLLVRNADDGAWGIPGGLIEPFESPSDAAVREVWEETGLYVDLTRIIGIFGGPGCETIYPNGEKISWVATIFSGRVIEGIPRPDLKETTEVRFIRREDLSKIPCRDHVMQFLTVMEDKQQLPYFAPTNWRPAR